MGVELEGREAIYQFSTSYTRSIGHDGLDEDLDPEVAWRYLGP